jgi:hypothetical protein
MEFFGITESRLKGWSFRIPFWILAVIVRSTSFTSVQLDSGLLNVTPLGFGQSDPVEELIGENVQILRQASGIRALRELDFD